MSRNLVYNNQSVENQGGNDVRTFRYSWQGVRSELFKVLLNLKLSKCFMNSMK